MREEPTASSSKIKVGDFDPEAILRWQNGGKKYGPWAYSQANLAWKAEAIGDSTEVKLSWREFSSRQRELLHEMPLDYTRRGLKRGMVYELDALTRSRMVANSWHVGVAKYIIGKVIVFAESLRLEMVQPAEPSETLAL